MKKSILFVQAVRFLEIMCSPKMFETDINIYSTYTFKTNPWKKTSLWYYTYFKVFHNSMCSTWQTQDTCSLLCGEDDPRIIYTFLYLHLTSFSFKGNVENNIFIFSGFILAIGAFMFLAVSDWMGTSHSLWVLALSVLLLTASWCPTRWCWYESRCRRNTPADRVLGCHSSPVCRSDTENSHAHTEPAAVFH